MANEEAPRFEDYREDASGAPRVDFVDQVIAIVESIPSGQVMTYGDIAQILTSRAGQDGVDEAYGPRMVGFVMSRFGSSMPWWRVIRSSGHPPRFHQDQARPHYDAERTPLIETTETYRIDLRRARYLPD